ncbi:MAG: hypothetical protein K6E49_08410 [Lachnospiraceae bacterium]|nr:hypothetical protein [Lachnospiraceae bacterium]
MKTDNIKRTITFSFIAFTVSQFITPAVETTKWIILVRAALIAVSVLSYLLAVHFAESSEPYNRQLSWMSAVIALFSILYCAAAMPSALYIRYYSQIFLMAAWLFASLFAAVRNRKVLAASLSSLTGDTRFYIGVAFCFSLILTVLSYGTDGPHFVWDANSMYNELENFGIVDVFNLRALFVFTHIDISYFLPLLLLTKLTGSMRAAFFTYNMLCIIGASFGIVFLLRKTLPGRGRLFTVAASAACLFSPYICGLSTYYSYDYAICCLIPLLLLFAFNEDWIYFISLALYISFLKETGFIYAGSVFGAVMIAELLCDRRPLSKVVIRFRTVAYMMIVVLFVILYKSISSWDENFGEGFTYKTEHILTQLRMYFIFNFEWVVSCAIIIMLVIYALQKKSIGRYAAVYAVSSAVFLAFNLVYVTYENPRYMDAFPICMMLLFVTLLAGSDISEGLKTCIASCLALLMGAASFFSFDPITPLFFYTADTGRAKLYASDAADQAGGDQSVYNRQYYGLDIVFDRALSVGIDNGDELIAVSTGDFRNTWAVDGGHYSYKDTDERRYFTEFWDNLRQRREPAYDYEFINDDIHTVMDIRYIYPDDDINEALSAKDSFIYIYLPSFNSGREEAVRAGFTVTEEGTFTSHGWVMSYIRGTKAR